MEHADREGRAVAAEGSVLVVGGRLALEGVPHVLGQTPPLVGDDHLTIVQAMLEVLYSIAEQIEGSPIGIGDSALGVELEDDLGQGVENACRPP